MPRKTPLNPFYVLLIPVGVAFVVTATAYGIMAFQAVNPAPVDESSGFAVGAGHPLIEWLRKHGDVAMLGELAVLAVLTVAAMAYDSWVDRRPKSESRIQGE